MNNGWRLIHTKRLGRCCKCNRPIPSGRPALYNFSARTLAHQVCPTPETR